MNIQETLQQKLGKEIAQASNEEIYGALLSMVQEMAGEKERTDSKKKLYYISEQFLIGKLLSNNMINLGIFNEVKDVLAQNGKNIAEIEEVEPEPSLGNGGLGRLAACFLDSLATLGYAAYGCGIRYQYGMFKQKIKDGYQIEVPDEWLKNGNPFELKRPEYAKEVRFGGNIRTEYDEATGRTNFIQENYQSVMAVPFDYPIVGYGNHIVNTLRIWDAEAIVDFQLDSFDR